MNPMYIESVKYKTSIYTISECFFVNHRNVDIYINRVQNYV